MLERFEGKQENFKYLKLTEEQQKKRGILGRLVGVIADTKNSTRNERLYSKELWESVFDNPIMQEKIKNKVVYGQLGHPTNDEDLTADGIEKVAVALAEKPKIGSDGKIYGVFDILNTPNGRILKTLCDYGSTLGISSRGDGEVIETENGSEVDPESYNCICWDVVLVPGVKDARLKYMTESLQTKKEERMKKKLNETLNKANEDDRKVMTETLHNLNITIDTENEEQPKVSVSVDDKEPVEVSGAEEQPIEEPETEETPVEEPVADEEIPAEEEITESLNEKDEAEEKSEEEIGDVVAKEGEEQPVDLDVEEQPVETTEIPAEEETKDAMTQICDSSIIGELLKHYIDLNTTIKSNILGNDSISEETKEIIKNVNDEVAKSIEALQNGLVAVNNKSIEDNAEEEVIEPDDMVLDDIDKESSEEAPENEPEEVTDSESDEVVESFKETLKENANLIKEVKSLNEKLAVRNSEADKLNEELDSKKKLIESLNNKLKSNSKEVSTLKEQLEVRDIKVKRFKKLYEDAQANSAKTATSLNESLEKGSKDTINRLNEKDTQIKKLNESLNSINSKYEKETTNLNAQVKTLKESYIKARAKVLGVPAERIIKYLPENYSIQDIDTTCEKIEDDNLRLSNLPFGIARGTKVSTGSAINSQETSIADDFVADLLHY